MLNSEFRKHTALDFVIHTCFVLVCLQFTDNGRGNGNGGSRFQKKREPAQWSKANNDPGQQRKFTPQKTKAFDKRPRSRKDWTGRRDEVRTQGIYKVYPNSDQGISQK